MKLTQKSLLKSTREFEISGDTVFVRIKGLLKEKNLTVSLSALDPEPDSSGTELLFLGRNNHEPLLRLLINQPSANEFNEFVSVLRDKILSEQTAAVSGHHEAPGLAQPQAPGWNVYDEPPDFDDMDNTHDTQPFQPVNPDRLAEDIRMLRTYLNEEEIKPLLEALETLRLEPQSQPAFQKMLDSYNALGVHQGAVLTYTSYLKILLSKFVWA